MGNKKILILTPSIKLGGGAEKVAIELGEKLALFGHKVYILTFQKDKEEYTFKKGKLINLNQPKNIIFKIFSIFINPILINKIVKQEEINVIISHTERANFISGFIGFLNKKIKTIGVVHNHKYLNNFFNRIFIKITYRYINKIITVSKRIENELKIKYKLKNVETIYNGFNFNKIEALTNKKIENLEDEKYFKGDNIIFINIGRLVKQKGQLHLIKAFYKVNKEYPNTKLIIIGKGPLKNKIQKLINKLGLSRNVHLLGKRKNVFPYLKKSNCFVFSSLWEGFGLVLVEALYTGLPVISTDCDAGPREILAPELGINEKIKYNFKANFGLLTKPIKKNKDIEYLYKGMKLYILNKLKPDDNVKNYLKSKFSEENTLKKWINILENN